MRIGRFLRPFGGLLFSAALALAQGASESLEREARAAFKASRFKEAAIKFQDAADSATESPRRAKMQLQAGYALFNDKDVKAAREAVRRALETDKDIEIIPEFYAPDFLRLVEDVKRVEHPGPPPAPVDVVELKRVVAEKLKDGHADEVVYDLTHVPPEKLDADAWKLLATAYDALGKPVQAEAARRAAAGGSTASPTSGSAGDVAPTLADGRTALQSGDLAAAQAAAARALDMQPASSEAHRLLGDTAAARGDLAAAEASWKKALEADPKNEAAAESLLGAYLDAKNVEAALPVLKANPALVAKTRPKIMAFARSLAKENDPRARTTFAALSAAAPNDAGLLSEYGGALLSGGDVDGAVDALRRAVEAAPTSAAAHGNLAVALRKKGDAAEAEKEYRQALAIDADSPQALAGLGALFLASAKPAEAVEPLKRAAAHELQNVGVLVALVRAQRESGDAAGAVATVEAARGADDAALWNEAGAAAYALGRYPDAVGYFERALAKDRESAAARASLEKARQAQAFMARLEKQAPLQGLVTTK
jgi:tetratricopeptide (TPR) repeat protein